jgi:integrase
VLEAFKRGESPRKEVRVRSGGDWGHLLGDVPVEEAVRFYAMHHGMTSPVTVNKVVEEFVNVKRQDQVSNAYINCLNYHFREFGKKYGTSYIRNITTPELNVYLRSITDLRTRHNHRASLCSLFKFAMEQNYIPQALKSPAAATTRTEVPAKTPDLFTPDELKKLFNAANYRDIGLLIAGAYAGIRMAEIDRLTWGDILWEENAFVLTAEKTKTGRRRLAYFPESVSEGFKKITEMYRIKPEDRIVPGKFYKRLKAVCERAGVRWKKNAFRKTFISCRMAIDRDAPRIAEQCGNSVEMVQNNYKGLVTKNQAEEWFAVFDTRAILEKLY